MILPNKYLTITESFVGISALILDIIGNKKITLDLLWNKFEKKIVIKIKKIKKPSNLSKIYLCVGIYVFNWDDYI